MIQPHAFEPWPPVLGADCLHCPLPKANAVHTEVEGSEVPVSLHTALDAAIFALNHLLDPTTADTSSTERAEGLAEGALLTLSTLRGLL